ncbi:MAG TPA: VanZ family protein [Polyangiaceae bacterium]|nr:VanZ family protein [Polyangiaceae bacterium]
MILPLAYAAAIFYGGVINIGELPHTRFVASDKLLHAGAFMGLEVLVEWALLARAAQLRHVLAVGAAIGVGALLELVQAALPYRSADIWDLFADSVGACLGAIAWAVFTKIQGSRNQAEPS